MMEQIKTEACVGLEATRHYDWVWGGGGEGERHLKYELGAVHAPIVFGIHEREIIVS